MHVVKNAVLLQQAGGGVREARGTVAWRRVLCHVEQARDGRLSACRESSACYKAAVVLWTQASNGDAYAQAT